jgi:AraC-like DNA-binding protein
MIILKPQDIFPVVKVANYMALNDPHAHKWPRRRIPDFELILAIHGDFEFINHETDEKTRHPAGSVLVIYPREYHSYKLISSKGLFSCIHCELIPDGVFANGDYTLEPFPPRITQTEGGELQELFRRAAHTAAHPGRFSEEILNTIVREIWLRLAEKWLSSGGGRRNIRLEEMLNYLNENLPRQPGRSELAKKFFLTPQHVNLIFKKELGFAPTEYVHRELARAGYRMLHEDGLNVKETADRLGFSSQFYFSRIFKKVFGIPPSSV